jgi:hypothetical protein
VSAVHLDPASLARTVHSLAESLGVESRLLTQLVEILEEQREGVARDDVQQVDDSVHAAHRVLQTLGEARSRRQTLVHLLTDRRDITVNELDEALGPHMTTELSERSRELEQVARSVSEQVALNRSVLTRAIQSGNEYVQRLMGTSAVGYGGKGTSTRGGSEPTLINQRV